MCVSLSALKLINNAFVGNHENFVINATVSKNFFASGGAARRRGFLWVFTHQASFAAHIRSATVGFASLPPIGWGVSDIFPNAIRCAC